MQQPATDLFSHARHCLFICDPAQKIDAVKRMREQWSASGAEFSVSDDSQVDSVPVPGRPERPRLVPPSQVPKRSLATEAGRIRLVHAIAHIEFNAINLALDAVYRFRGMPRQYYTDWLQVAAEEGMHFSLLQNYLLEHGSFYGEFDAHNGLWEMALKTDHDVMVRMALVPRVLEARGLDVTPTMIAQLNKVGDDALVAILEVIFRDEIGHVKIGNRWFHHACEQDGLDAQRTFLQLVDEHMGRPLPGPLETDARKTAGFSEHELELLMSVPDKP